MRRIVIFVLFVLFVAAWSPASAQIIGPGPEQGKVQIGGWVAFIHHDALYKNAWTGQTWRISRNYEYQRGGLSLRYGVTNSAYAILNFGHLVRDDEEHNDVIGVLGIGGNVRLLTPHRFAVRVGGHYNHVFENHGPYLARDARVALTVDRSLRGKAVQLTGAVGVMFFRATNNMHDPDTGAQSRSRHYVSPVVASVLTLHRRVNLGLELTFGAITDFRWRTEIQL